MPDLYQGDMYMIIWRREFLNVLNILNIWIFKYLENYKSSYTLGMNQSFLYIEAIAQSIMV